MMDYNFNYNGKLAIKVEHDACGSDHENDVKPKFKFNNYNNYVKCENKCFDAVDKWINKAIVKVPTGDNWHNIIQREIALMKVRYPFLTEKQLKGRALVKFGIPCLMGNIIRTGEKKVTGTLASQLLRTRERKSRIPAPFKAVKKFNPFVKKLKSSPPLKLKNYSDSNPNRKVFDMSTETPKTPIKTYSKYGLRNPYHSADKENSCPSTPRKRKVYDPKSCTWLEIKSDEQTPTKKRRLTPAKPEDRKFYVSITQAAKTIFVASPESELSLESVAGFSQSSIRQELLEKLRKYPFAGRVDWNDTDSEKSSAPEVLPSKITREISTTDINPSSQASAEFIPSPMTPQSRGIPENISNLATPSQLIVSPTCSWPDRKFYEPVSFSELNTIRCSFERLSFNESQPPISFPSMGAKTPDLSIKSKQILSQNSLPTPSLLSQKSFPFSLDHDYAKSDSQQVTPGFCVSLTSQDIPTPSLYSQSALLRTPTLSNLSSIRSFSEDEFSDAEDSGPGKLLSDCCDEFDEGWRKVTPSRVVSPSTDIREKMKSVTMQEIKEQVQGVINFLDGL